MTSPTETTDIPRTVVAPASSFAVNPNDERQLIVKVTGACTAGPITAVSYTLRGVINDEEVKVWTEFCASVFAYKANPPPASYFARHYFNDPCANSPSLIRIALHEGAIVASCRVFRRTISLTQGQSTVAGGIGEVCTSALHRNRGLAKELLRDAIRIMHQEANNNTTKMQVSLLHAAPDFFSVYEKSGYACIRSRWTQITIDTARLLQQDDRNDSNRHAIRQARFPDDTPQLMAMHHQYSEQRFAGCIVRSAEYWNNYVSEELCGSLWVLVDEDDTRPTRIMGWMSIRLRGDSFQLREFGCRSIASVPWVFHKLLSHLVQAERDLSSHTSCFRLNMPTKVLEETQVEGNSLNFISAATENDDLGWMYKTLDSERKGFSAKIVMPDITKSFPHLIWPTDSF